MAVMMGMIGIYLLPIRFIKEPLMIFGWSVISNSWIIQFQTDPSMYIVIWMDRKQIVFGELINLRSY
jgi:hypothetical protein